MSDDRVSGQRLTNPRMARRRTRSAREAERIHHRYSGPAGAGGTVANAVALRVDADRIGNDFKHCRQDSTEHPRPLDLLGSDAPRDAARLAGRGAHPRSTRHQTASSVAHRVPQIHFGSIRNRPGRYTPSGQGTLKSFEIENRRLARD